MVDEEPFERLARLAAALFQVQTCAIGEAEPAAGAESRGPVEADLFRRTTLAARGPVMVSDAREDERFRRSSLVTAGPGIRFYAGVPLRRASGQTWGTLELFDDQVRSWSMAERSLLIGFGRWAEAERELIEFRRGWAGVGRARDEAEAEAHSLQEELAVRIESERRAGKAIEVIERQLRGAVRELGAAVARLALHGEFSAALTRPEVESEDIPRLLARRLADVVGDLSLVLLRSADGERFDAVAVHHRDPATAGTLRASLATIQVRGREGPIAAVMASGEPIFLPLLPADTHEGVGFELKSLLDPLALTSVLAVALRADGHAVGVVFVARTAQEQGPLTRGDLNLAQDLTNRAGEVMNNLAVRAALAASEHRFRRLVDNAPDVIYRARLPEFSLEYVSPVAQTLLGYTAEDFYAHPGLGLEIVHPEDRAILTSLLADPHRVAPGPVLLRWVRADGEILWMDHRVAPVVDDAGQVIAFEGIARDVTALKAAQDDLVHRTLHDGLTDLPNRDLFHELLAAGLRRLERQPASLAVLYLDLDRFKVINDSLGHHVGDALLIAIADRLRSVMRPSDTVARLGGDEFAVLVDTGPDPQIATHLADRIQADLTAPVLIGGVEVFTTASIGIAMTDDPTTDPHDLLRHADVAMYQAKAAGGGRFEIFDEWLGSIIQRQLAEENALRQAIGEDELRVLYQPITELATGEIVAVEALARWQRGSALAGADSFIGLAEDTGLIVPIGAWVLEQAYRDTARINRHRDRPLRVHVNVSARQLVDDRLTAVAAEIAGHARGTATTLCLEITESMLMANPVLATEILGHLHSLGVQVAIDDFGTGHSSLSYLRRLPVDVLKIDGSFIEGIDADPAAAAIVAAIIALAHQLDLQVTAEGVETPGQLATLKALHCEEAQGFLLAEPLTAIELDELLTRT